MLDFKKLPLDAQLTALIDGETTPEQKLELEQRVATDDGAKRLYDKLRHGADFGKRRMDDVLKEPVPLALVRSIKNVQPPKAPIAPRLSRPSLKLTPSRPQAIAAALVLFAAGCGVGYLVADNRSAPASSQTVEAAPEPNEWLDDITAYQRLLARQPRHLVEVPASQSEEISSWLTTTVGVAFRVPDISDGGWTFQGARVVLADGKPAGQLIYTSADGDTATIAFRKDNQPDDTEDFKETIRDEIGLVTWHNAGTSYVLVGPSAEATLIQLAMQIATEI
ncbi:Fis family transcriptional regulator [Rhizobium sp. AC44/96]|uniref:anti-sigma factor family protein n=1 Tax=Rhizobium sp. AC44/96 TaxID=1841654 RepID=UPI00080FEE89|nr:anti-sigma factor [Rhizobium sp. AC44/96]OCJ16271.1 Fis family transcriptional regulator [Rhizobium sp. AC44/96]